MPAYRIAAQTRRLAGTLKKALHIAAQMGCAGVQIEARQELRPSDLSETGARQLRKLLDDLNLRVGSVVYPTRRGYSEPADLERRLEGTRAAMQLAAQLHARVLLCNLGSVPEEADSPQRAVLEEAITDLSALATRIGVKLVAQNSPVDTSVLMSLVSSLPEAALWLDLHPAQLIAQGRSPAEFIAAAGKHIAHVHAADGVFDLASGRGVEVELGRGSADFPQLLGLLEEHEYRGWLTLERLHSQDITTDITNAIRYLHSM